MSTNHFAFLFFGFSLNNKVGDLIEISNYAYDRDDILEKEKQVLNKLDWYLTVPTLYMFLVRFIKAARADKQVCNNDLFEDPFSMLYFPCTYLQIVGFVLWWSGSVWISSYPHKIYLPVPCWYLYDLSCGSQVTVSFLILSSSIIFVLIYQFVGKWINDSNLRPDWELIWEK